MCQMGVKIYFRYQMGVKKF